ncbi:MAG TPA: ferredoxin [Bacilli bacterium]|nr:ferredoxin [Bacilli bacterium]
MKVKVLENLCIGCGACQALEPDMFEINDNGVSECVAKVENEEDLSKAKEAANSCPTNAISVSEE